MRKRWAVFISGTGSNMMAALERPAVAQVCLVVSSKESAYGLVRAKRRGIPTLVLDKNLDWNDLSRRLLDLKIDRILLAGFMKIIPAQFIKKWENKIINIHPSVLPAYPGLGSIERAFQDGKNSGATIHIVTEGVDEGPILFQKIVPLENDLPTTEFMVHVQEHRLVRKALEL